MRSCSAVGAVLPTDVPHDLRAALTERYLRGLASADPLERATAGRQLGQLRRRGRCSNDHEPTESLPSVREAIEQVVGPLHERPNGDLEGACPWHASASGRCLIVFAGGVRWWCRLCRRGGDAAAWHALIEGISLSQARRRLGLPTGRQPRARCRPTLCVEVGT
jgi:hypothetical protein